jgi:hypothetical protein
LTTSGTSDTVTESPRQWGDRKDTSLERTRYLTGEQLREAARQAVKRDYNRQLDQSFVRSLPREQRYPIVFSMLHEHSHGHLVEPHVRCQIVTDAEGHTVMLDIPLEMYQQLDSWVTPDRPAMSLS